MTMKTNHSPRDTSHSARPLKDSDFFPPGAGWNRSKNSDDTDRPRHYPTEERHPERNKQH